ncbi:ATP-binding protein [Granulicella sibirica]|uniref:histidine kinase n=1 Tax=Granulicella sibirica TaxID=2479048 RepID=A0A4V1L5S8_9BACT|nr:ATP-binding protein [Granulicella sibirica]RXH56814.1 Phytochrome, two-component sensor histidine kinase [Granulicella sibirica]
MTTTIHNCEDEEIRIPGSIQRHGFLLLLDEPEGLVVGASENVPEFLDVPLRLILGTSIDTILEREVLSALRGAVSNAEAPGLLTYLGSFQLRGEFYSVVTHRVDGRRVLEFERVERLVSPELMNAVFTNFVSKLSKFKDEAEVCAAITRQVKELTGFNRVLLYSFDEVGHGTVLAEENDGTLPSYLHLKFPASDIPKQARDLYVLNTVRSIPDAAYEPSPLKALGSRSMAGFDMSMSLLRSVSPIHLEYMRNMGTISSMSISIVCEGRLWGLISGHHATPHTVPYLVRSACDLLTKMVGTQLVSFRTTARLGKMVHFHGVHRKILTSMAAENNYIAAMIAQMEDVIEVTDAAGVAMILDGVCQRAGRTPDDAAVLRLAEWFDGHPEIDLFETRSLRQEIDWAEEIREIASGLIAIRISDVRQSYLMWFRPEVVSTVQWAGEPAKAVGQRHGLHPRDSFESWKQLVKGESAPWTEMEVESAREFRASVMTISLKRAEEAYELSEARFRQLTHTLPNLVWTASDDGTLTYVNQKWIDQGLGEMGCWYEREGVVEEDRERCRELWSKSVSEGTPFEAELRFLDEDEMERWNLVRAVPFLRVNHSRAGWVGTCTDLTDQRERERALRMTEKLALTGRMTSVIAHEINNPLESITNLLYLLGTHITDDEPAREYIRMAESELERISGITKQTLRWSREGNRVAESGNVSSLFKDVLRLFTGKIRNRQVTVTANLEDDATYFGVVGQIQQVVANLVSNAVDAVPVGGQIWLEASANDDATEIVVRDAGSGMSDETLRQLFQPFYSTKGDLGNGLGLYISQEIVERHGGTLELESRMGVGTVARVRLPLTPAA